MLVITYILAAFGMILAAVATETTPNLSDYLAANEIPKGYRFNWLFRSSSASSNFEASEQNLTLLYRDDRRWCFISNSCFIKDKTKTFQIHYFPSGKQFHVHHMSRRFDVITAPENAFVTQYYRYFPFYASLIRRGTLPWTVSYTKAGNIVFTQNFIRDKVPTAINAEFNRQTKKLARYEFISDGRLSYEVVAINQKQWPSYRAINYSTDGDPFLRFEFELIDSRNMSEADLVELDSFRIPVNYDAKIIESNEIIFEGKSNELLADPSFMP